VRELMQHVAQERCEYKASRGIPRKKVSPRLGSTQKYVAQSSLFGMNTLIRRMLNDNTRRIQKAA
jgi:hypothetical protein